MCLWEIPPNPTSFMPSVSVRTISTLPSGTNNRLPTHLSSEIIFPPQEEPRSIPTCRSWLLIHLAIRSRRNSRVAHTTIVRRVVPIGQICFWRKNVWENDGWHEVHTAPG